MHMIRQHTWLAALLVVIFWSASFAEAAPTMTVGSATAEPGGTVTVPVTLSNEAGVELSSLALDVFFSTDLIADIEASKGPAAEEAGKSLVANLVQPGQYRVGVISWSNKDAIGDGVVLYLQITVASSAPAKTAVLDASPSGSTPDADSVAIIGQDGAITIFGGNPEPQTSNLAPQRSLLLQP